MMEALLYYGGLMLAMMIGWILRGAFELANRCDEDVRRP